MSKDKKPDPKLTPEAEQAAQEKAANSARQTARWQAYMLGIAFILVLLTFLPTTLIFFFGLMPTFAALAIDPTPDRLKTWTVGFMNLAGCVPFLLELWFSGAPQTIERSFEIIARADTLIMIYGAAVVGYVLFYVVSSVVATVMLQSGRNRHEYIKTRMTELERKWGKEVTGAIPLNEMGFPDGDEDDFVED